jgi:integrase
LILDADTPHGSIKWPKRIDKQEIEVVVPMTAEARAIIDRILIDRELLDETLRHQDSEYLFPSPTDPHKPVSKDLASDWLERAEAAAGVRKLDGSLWHAYRRGWVSERKHLSDTDVAAVGGWTGTDTLKKCYQLPDDDSMLEVLEAAKPLPKDVE